MMQFSFWTPSGMSAASLRAVVFVAFGAVGLYQPVLAATHRQHGLHHLGPVSTRRDMRVGVCGTWPSTKS
jgi:hypothetical protein